MSSKVVRLIDHDVIKSSSAIHINGSVSHLARRMWNVLLAAAYPRLSDAEEHTIKISEVAETLQFNSHNTAHLKQALRELVGTVIEWNILGKDRGESWSVSSLLSHVNVENGNGTISYAYSHLLRRKLHNPSMFARIKLSLQNKFRSKYSLILYELVLDYFDASRQEGETPWISTEKFRDLMGVDGTQYPEFKALRKWVIGTAVEEVERLTEIDVDVRYQRQMRRVVAVKFVAKPSGSEKVKVKATPVPVPAKSKLPDAARSAEWKGPRRKGVGIGW